MDENQDDKPVNYNDMIEKFGFDENGPDHVGVIMQDPMRMATAYLFSRDVESLLDKEYPNRPDKRDNEIDAFRHALWSYMMAKYLGQDTAKIVGDAHEVHGLGVDSQGSRLMDLHNNEVGRQLAKSFTNRKLKDEFVIRKALDNGLLRTEPYPIAGDENRPSSVFGNRLGITATGNLYQGRQ